MPSVMLSNFCREAATEACLQNRLEPAAERAQTQQWGQTPATLTQHNPSMLCCEPTRLWRHSADNKELCMLQACNMQLAKPRWPSCTAVTAALPNRDLTLLCLQAASSFLQLTMLCSTAD